MISFLKKSIEPDKRCLPGVVMAVLFLSLPNLVVVFWPRVERYHVEGFWLGVGILLAPCVFFVSARTALRLWVPLVAFIPALVAYHLVAGAPMREWALVVLSETNWSELERFWVPALLAVLAAPLAVWFLWWFTGRYIPAGHRLGWLARVVILLCLVVIPLGQVVFGDKALESQVAMKRLGTTFPANLPFSAWRAWKIRADFAGRPALQEQVQAHSEPAGAREIYVLVLGESARFDSLQIHGYPRETTPLLAKMTGVLSFRDVIAPAPITTMSIPLLVTPASPENLQQTASLPSVVTVFRRAGFHTAWYSTQRQHGMYDTASSIFARDAHESRFLSGTFAPGRERLPSEHDGALLQPLRDLLTGGHDRLFIVLHTMGSHQNYADRYPPQFNHFPAQRLDIASRPFVRVLTEDQRRNLTNAYDNSLRYTDWFLTQVIEMLAKVDAVSYMIYISDHGQNRGDAEMLPFAHGNVTRDVMHVPMLVWLSPAYRALRHERAAILESHVSTPFTGSALFHTVVDAAALQCAALEPRLSAANAQFHPGPRLLRDMRGEVLDYDKLPLVAKSGNPPATAVSLIPEASASTTATTSQR